MVKKYFFISLLVMVGLTQKVDAEDREAEVQLKTAIGGQCVEEVQRLLKKNGLVTEKNKKEFVDAARKELDLLKQNSSVLRNVKDAPYVLGGGLLLAASGIALRYGIVTLRSAWEDLDNLNNAPMADMDDVDAAEASKNKALGVVTAAGVAGLVAGYIGKKGLCGEARDRCLKNAQTIVQLLEKA